MNPLLSLTSLFKSFTRPRLTYWEQTLFYFDFDIAARCYNSGDFILFPKFVTNKPCECSIFELYRREYWVSPPPKNGVLLLLTPAPWCFEKVFLSLKKLAFNFWKEWEKLWL